MTREWFVYLISSKAMTEKIGLHFLWYFIHAAWKKAQECNIIKNIGKVSSLSSQKGTNELVRPKVNSGMRQNLKPIRKAWQKKLLLVVLPFLHRHFGSSQQHAAHRPLVHSAASTELATQTLLSRKWNQNEQRSGHLRDRCRVSLCLSTSEVLRADVAFQVSLPKVLKAQELIPADK